MKERPLLVFILAYFSGIVVCKYFSVLNLGIFIFLLLYFIFFYKLRKMLCLILSGFILGCLFAGWYGVQLQQKIATVENLKRINPLELRIVSDITKRDDSLAFLARHKNYLLTVKINDAFRDYEYGDVFYLQRPLVFALGGNANFGMSNYDDYLKLHKVNGRIFFSEKDVLNYHKQFWSLRRQIYRWKNALVAVHQKTLPAPYSNLLASIIFGDTVAPLTEDRQLAYRRGGVVHLLVVSGSQIAILAGLFVAGAGLLRLNNWLTFLFCSVFLTAFTVATGFGASIARAWLMAELALGAVLLGRQKDFYTLLGLTAFLASLVNPLIILDIGFQLSYLATIALVYLAPVFDSYFKKYLPEKISKALSVSLAPLVFTAPLTILYFNTFSLIALPVNLLILCWVEIIVVSGFFATLFGLLFLPLAQLLNLFNGLLLLGLDSIVNIFNKIPGAVLNLAMPNVYVFILSMSVIICLVEYFRTRKNIFKLKALVLCLCLIVLGFAADRSLTITMFDVGQGESILIITPSNNTIMIDCGSEKGDPAKNIIIPYLRKNGFDHIDNLLVTHAHQDHISGLRTLINELKIKNIIADLPDDYIAVTVNPPALTNEIDLDKVKIRTIYAVSINAEENLNNCSVVYLLEYQSFKMLLTGDIEQKVERKLLKQPGLLPDVDILKVAHHGSNSSSSLEFLEKIRPEASVISVGKNNRYRHPGKKALDILLLYGTVYRTDLHGAIEIKVKKDGKYTISSSKRSSGS
jgi:competence protein ComEC